MKRLIIAIPLLVSLLTGAPVQGDEPVSFGSAVQADKDAWSQMRIEKHKRMLELIEQWGQIIDTHRAPKFTDAEATALTWLELQIGLLMDEIDQIDSRIADQDSRPSPAPVKVEPSTSRAPKVLSKPRPTKRPIRVQQRVPGCPSNTTCVQDLMCVPCPE